MSDLTEAVLERMQKREAPAPSVLARLGEADPFDGAEAFRHAASLPELAASAAEWVPKALTSAHPARSAVRLAELVVEGRASGRGDLKANQLPALAALLGAGDPFAEWVRERPEWIDAIASGFREAPKPPRAVWSEIRDAHGQGLLSLATSWLLGAPLAPTLRALSDLADGCVAAAVECAAGETGVAPPAVMAWGRYGSREPGLASALELLLVDADMRPESQSERASECARLAERLLEELPQQFEAGITYAIGPVDAGGLPAPDRCVLAHSQALAFFRMQDALVDRAPLVTLRRVAGSADSAAAFETEIASLLARHEQGDVEDAPQRRRPIFECGDPLEADTALISGSHGFAAVERIVRSLQLRHGLRRDGTLSEALEEIAREVPRMELHARGLAQAYTWLRRAELALGMLAAPSPVLPSDAEGQLAVARTMGYADLDAARALARFLYDWRAVRDEVHEMASRVRHEMGN